MARADIESVPLVRFGRGSSDPTHAPTPADTRPPTELVLRTEVWAHDAMHATSPRNAGFVGEARTDVAAIPRTGGARRQPGASASPAQAAAGSSVALPPHGDISCDRNLGGGDGGSAALAAVNGTQSGGGGVGGALARTPDPRHRLVNFRSGPRRDNAPCGYVVCRVCRLEPQQPPMMPR